jgi:hypothetical protein
MRLLPLVAVVLIGAGLWGILRPPSYTSEERLLKLGDIEARVQREHPLPGWIGGLLLGGGIVLLVTGLTRRK